jgi:protein-tyrosine phosphatase
MGYNAVIPGRLYMGSDPSGAYLSVDTLVLTAMEHQSNIYSGPKTILHVPLNDDGSPITQNEVRLALHASKDVARRVRRGEKVLVTCHMGKNRSGLVSALTLVNLGASASTAIRTVRAARGQAALRNRDFFDLVHLHGSAYGRQPQAMLCT